MKLAIFVLSSLLLVACQDSTDNSLKENEKKDGITNEIVKDIDGNSYRVIKIGEQFWLAENFKSTRFTDGNPIPSAVPYDNNSTMISSYGLTYRWNDFIDARLPPKGWRIPTINDFKKLVNSIGYIDSTNQDGYVINFMPMDSGSALWKIVTDYNMLNMKMHYGYATDYFCAGNGESVINLGSGYIYFSINRSGTRNEWSHIRLIKI